MKLWVVLLAPMLVSSYSYAHKLNQVTPVQYDHVYGSVKSGSYRSNSSDGDNVTAVELGIQHKFENSDLLWSADYGSRFVHFDSHTVDHYLLRAGLGYRWLLVENLDLVTRGKVGALRIDAGNKETDFVYSADIGLRYAVTDKFETSIFAEAIRNKWLDENVVTVSGDYYFYPKFSLGGFVSYRDAEHNISVREGGLMARFTY